MGAAAMTLVGGEYAIHGTNAPGSIGGFVSYGCIRMHNHDIVDLYGRVARRHAGRRDAVSHVAPEVRYRPPAAAPPGSDTTSPSTRGRGALGACRG